MGRLSARLLALGAASLSLTSIACTNGDPDPVATPETKAVELSGWSRVANAPIAHSSAAVLWTGTELFSWGGETNYGADYHADGALYDPAANRWRRVSAAPITGRSSAAAVWTGEEALVWGGSTRTAKGDGASYDPASATWRLLAPSPLSPRRPLVSVWTGREMIIWGAAERRNVRRDGAAYDPEGDRWRQIAPAPLALNQANAVWTGEEMIVLGSLLNGSNLSASDNARGLAFSPSTNRWRVLPDHPLSPQASSAAWTSAGMLVWDYLLRAALYDPATDRWSTINRLPLSPSECYPQSAALETHVFAWYCGQAALYDLEAKRWKPISPPRALDGGAAVAVGKGSVLVGPVDSAGGYWRYGVEPSSPTQAAGSSASTRSGVSLDVPAGWSSRTNGADFVNPRLCYELSSEERDGPVRVHGSTARKGAVEIRIVEVLEGPAGPDTRPPRISLSTMTPAGAVEWTRGSVDSFRENDRWIYIGAYVGHGASAKLLEQAERALNSIEVSAQGIC